MSAFFLWLGRQLLIAVAAILLCLSVMLALLDRVPAASLIAGLFIVVALFHYLPQMESFKAYGVEAKWRARINEADEILNKLKQSTLASAKLTYMTLGWGSRFSGPRSREKQAVADQVDAALRNLNVDQEEISSLKKDYLFFATFDIFQLFDAIVQKVIDENRNKLTLKIHNLKIDDKPQADRLELERDFLKEERAHIDLLEVLPSADFRVLCQSRVPSKGLEQQDREKLLAFIDKITNAVEEMRSSGRVVDAASNLIEMNSMNKRQELYKDMFG